MYEIRIIQLSENIYFWVLKECNDNRVIAKSLLMGSLYEVEAEARHFANLLGVGICVFNEEGT